MMTVWMVIIIAGLVYEFIRMELYGGCVAAGAIVGLVLYAFKLPVYVQIPAAVIVAVLLMVFLRPIGIKYINRMKRESKRQDLVGRDTVVISAISASKGPGIVLVGSSNYSAVCKRPNGVIKEGTLVKIVTMKGDTAVVDDGVRNRSALRGEEYTDEV